MRNFRESYPRMMRFCGQVTPPSTPLPVERCRVARDAEGIYDGDHARQASVIHLQGTYRTSPSAHMVLWRFQNNIALFCLEYVMGNIRATDARSSVCASIKIFSEHSALSLQTVYSDNLAEGLCVPAPLLHFPILIFRLRFACPNFQPTRPQNNIYGSRADQRNRRQLNPVSRSGVLITPGLRGAQTLLVLQQIYMKHEDINRRTRCKQGVLVSSAEMNIQLQTAIDQNLSDQ